MIVSIFVLLVMSVLGYCIYSDYRMRKDLIGAIRERTRYRKRLEAKGLRPEEIDRILYG